MKVKKIENKNLESLALDLQIFLKDKIYINHSTHYDPIYNYHVAILIYATKEGLN